MKYAVILSTRGREEVVLATDDPNEASAFEDSLRMECRREDPDGAELDCFIRSEKEARRLAESVAFWASLTDEDRHDIIEVAGRRYVRKVWERNHEEVMA